MSGFLSARPGRDTGPRQGGGGCSVSALPKSASVGADGLLQVGQGLLRLHAVVRHLLHHGLDGAVDGAGGGGSIGKHGLIEITVTLLYTGPHVLVAVGHIGLIGRVLRHGLADGQIASVSGSYRQVGVMGGHKLDKFIGGIHSVLIPVLIQGDNDMAGGEVGGGILAHLRNRGGSPVQLGIFVWDIAGLHAVADIHGDHLIGKGPGEELILPRSTPDTLIHVILPHLKHLQGNVAVLGGKVQIAVLVGVAAAVLEQQGHKAACQVVPAKGGRAGNVSDGAAGFHQLVPGGGNTESVLGKKRLVVIEHLGVGVDRQGIDTLLGIAGVRLPQPFKDVLVVGHAHIGICNIVLRGNISQISKHLYEEMQSLAAELKFEEAQKIKEKYEVIENYRSKSTVVTPMLHNIDVFTIIENDHSAYVNFMHIGNGAIVQAYTFEYKKRLDETKEELLSLGIIEMRNRFKSTAREIIVPFKLDMQLENVTFTIPQRGDKKKLLDLSEMNVKQFKVDRLKQAEKLNPEQRNTRILKEIQEALHLEKLPAHIECFDNSNIQGSDAVAACVVFKMGKPSKQEYRKYNIKTVVGPDDYASMKEVVRRRYGRAIEERSPLPDLIITDGGKGQMEVVRSVVEDELGLSIPIAGLAKDGKHRTSELLFGFPPVTVGMRLDSPLFHLLTRIQDEVHRFAITFHKDKRSKTQTKSELDTIKGIGEKTKVLLLRHFKSVKRIKEASFEELKSVIGEAKAKALQEGLDGKRTESEQK